MLLITLNLNIMCKKTNSQLVYNNTIDSTKLQEYDNRTIIPYYTLYSDKIVLTPKLHNYIADRKVSSKSLENLKKPKFNGNISDTQRRLITKKLTAWINSIHYYNKEKNDKYTRKKHYPVFLTLTLPSMQRHTDKEIKRILLDEVIKYLKRKYEVRYYFWRAEAQKNGNIHFHLIIDKYVKYSDILQTWNNLLQKSDYLAYSKKKYKSGYAHSVNIKGVTDVNNFVNYVVKYATKDEKSRKIEGRVFGMSDKLRDIDVYRGVLEEKSKELLNMCVDNDLLDIYKGEYFTVLFFTKNMYKSELYQQLQNLAADYYYALYYDLYLKSDDFIFSCTSYENNTASAEIQLSLNFC